MRRDARWWSQQELIANHRWLARPQNHQVLPLARPNLWNSASKCFHPSSIFFGKGENFKISLLVGSRRSNTQECRPWVLRILFASFQVNAFLQHVRTKSSNFCLPLGVQGEKRGSIASARLVSLELRCIFWRDWRIFESLFHYRSNSRFASRQVLWPCFQDSTKRPRLSRCLKPPERSPDCEWLTDSFIASRCNHPTRHLS